PERAGLCGAGSAGVEGAGDGRRRPAVWVLLRAGHLVPPAGASADQARRQEVLVIGDGGGVWSWVQIEDAAVATADALTAPPGVYNVVDDDPSPVAVWLPAFARFVGAPPPPRITEEQARASAGEDAVYTAQSSAALRTRTRRRHSASRPVVSNG